jgi:hypothetical protein
MGVSEQQSTVSNQQSAQSQPALFLTRVRADRWLLNDFVRRTARLDSSQSIR